MLFSRGMMGGGGGGGMLGGGLFSVGRSRAKLVAETDVKVGFDERRRRRGGEGRVA